MKLFTTILLFYFSSLIVQPMVILIHNGIGGEKMVCTMECCKKHRQPQKKQTPKSPLGGCNNDMSNPFAQCCCCTGFLTEKQYAGITISTKKITIVSTNTGILIPNYSSDCWRPPELAA